MTAWDVLINRDDLRRVELRHAAEKIDLAEGEVLLEVERFALTANNITYGAMGDSFGYWKFFPAPEGLGRIPVWGFARVVESQAAGLPALVSSAISTEVDLGLGLVERLELNDSMGNWVRAMTSIAGTNVPQPDVRYAVLSDRGFSSASGARLLEQVYSAA